MNYSERGIKKKSIIFTTWVLVIGNILIFLLLLNRGVCLWHPEKTKFQGWFLSLLDSNRLTSAFNRQDLIKPLMWDKVDGSYRSRQLSYFFELISNKIQVYTRYYFGATYNDITIIFIIFLCALFIGIIVYRYTNSIGSSAIAGSCFLASSQVMQDICFIFRNAKSLVTLFSLIGGYLLILACRKQRPFYSIPFYAFLFIIFINLFIDEVALLTIPFYWAIIFFSCGYRALLKIRLWICFLAIGVLYLFLFAYLFPHLSSRITLAPTLASTTNALQWLIGSLRSIGYYIRSINGAVFHTVHNLGNYTVCSLLWKILLIIFYIVLLLYFLLSARKRFLLLVAGFYGSYILAYYFIILQRHLVIPEFIYSPFYYLFPSIPILYIFIGCLSYFSPFQKRASYSFIFIFIFLVISVSNLVHLDILRIPKIEEHGFKKQQINEAKKILYIDKIKRSLEANCLPIYIAYPQEKVEDINWLEYQNRMWSGSMPYSVYPAIIPIMYLRDFEVGSLVNQPEMYERLKNYNPDVFLTSAKVYWDVPHNSMIDLEKFRFIIPQEDYIQRNFEYITFKQRGEGIVKSFFSNTLFGKTHRSRFSIGSWKTRFYLGRRCIDSSELRLFFFLRSRRACHIRFLIKQNKDVLVNKATSSYLWSYEICSFPMQLGDRITDTFIGLSISGDSEFEIIGPFLIPETVFQNLLCNVGEKKNG